MVQYHIGVDLHLEVAQIAVVDASGELVHEARVEIPDLPAGRAMLDRLAPYLEAGRLAVEALGCNRWFVDECHVRGWDVLVANATKLQLKRDGRKTDRRDAREIARRLFLGDLDRCARTYYPTQAEYAHRKLLRTRHGQVEKRTCAELEIHAILTAYKLRSPAKQLRSRESIRWLRSVALPHPDLRVVLDVLIEDLVSAMARIRVLSKAVAAAARSVPAARLLEEALPSVASQTSLTLICELGDVKRFSGARAVASFAGLVPRVTASADTSHHGKLTKHGNPELRWILGQLAVRLLSRDPVVKAWGARMRRRLHKNKVRVALARRLLIGIWVMLSRGEVFSMERCLGARAA